MEPRPMSLREPTKPKFLKSKDKKKITKMNKPLAAKGKDFMNIKRSYWVCEKPNTRHKIATITKTRILNESIKQI